MGARGLYGFPAIWAAYEGFANPATRLPSGDGDKKAGFLALTPYAEEAAKKTGSFIKLILRYWCLYDQAPGVA
jgi:hypothetical protein